MASVLFAAVLSFVSTTSALAQSVQTPLCVGDEDDSGTVTIDELITGVNIALGKRSDFCAVFDADRSGEVTINELVLAVNAALDGCGVIRTVDLSEFREFHFERQPALGFCPPLDAVFEARIRSTDAGYLFEVAVLQEGERGVGECLPDFYPEERCAIVSRELPRLLSLEGAELMRAAFRSLTIRTAQAPLCRGCAIDPCLINAVEWDRPTDRFFADDYVCGSNRRLDDEQSAALIELLEALRHGP